MLMTYLSYPMMIMMMMMTVWFMLTMSMILHIPLLHSIQIKPFKKIFKKLSAEDESTKKQHTKNLPT